jgi:predicted nucleic acid-binding protein
MIFIDTPAIYALADKADVNHSNAYEKFDQALKSGETFLLHNYILLESATLLESRLGLRPALTFLKDARVFDTEWVDLALHQEAMNEFEKNGGRGISLIDCMSFVVMRRRGVKKILTYDTNFRDQGFTIY